MASMDDDNSSMSAIDETNLTLYAEKLEDFYNDFHQPLLEQETQEEPFSQQKYDWKQILGLRIIFLPLIIVFVWLAAWMNYNLPHCSLEAGLYIRKEWRELKVEEQYSYLDAIKCMTESNSKLNLNTSRYDDFTYAHINTFHETHGVAISMPWHRYFIWVWEQTLRQECGYEGYLPYWDWMIDTTNSSLSSIWDPINGFGGDGVADGCVQDGPLKNSLLNYTEDGYQPHCLNRNLTETSVFNGGQSNAVKLIVETAKTYQDFRQRLETGPHKQIHKGIKGEMKTAFSTNDPLFFLHHAQLDRIWSIWQSRDPGSRQWAYGGKTMSGKDVSLKDIIDTFTIRKNITVLDVLNIRDGPFCYGYSSVF